MGLVKKTARQLAVRLLQPALNAQRHSAIADVRTLLGGHSLGNACRRHSMLSGVPLSPMSAPCWTPNGNAYPTHPGLECALTKAYRRCSILPTETCYVMVIRPQAR